MCEKLQEIMGIVCECAECCKKFTRKMWGCCDVYGWYMDV